MATTHPLPPHPPRLERGTETPETAAATGEEALVTQVRVEREQADEPPALTPAVATLPVELDISIPVRSFRVRNLLALEPGSLMETQWSHGEDIPLSAGDVQLAWSEFEVAEFRLAVRVTRLAGAGPAAADWSRSCRGWQWWRPVRFRPRFGCVRGARRGGRQRGRGAWPTAGSGEKF